MTVRDVLDKYPIDTIIFVVKKMKIHWNSIRFDNTSINPMKFIIEPKQMQTFYSSPTRLENVDPDSMLNSIDSIDDNTDDYECFLTFEEAEIWKILELHELDNHVTVHINSIKAKAEKKIKAIKAQQKLDEYISKYPEIVMKVM